MIDELLILLAAASAASIALLLVWQWLLIRFGHVRLPDDDGPVLTPEAIAAFLGRVEKHSIRIYRAYLVPSGRRIAKRIKKPDFFDRAMSVMRGKAGRAPTQAKKSSAFFESIAQHKEQMRSRRK